MQLFTVKRRKYVAGQVALVQYTQSFDGKDSGRILSDVVKKLHLQNRLA